MNWKVSKGFIIFLFFCLVCFFVLFEIGSQVAQVSLKFAVEVKMIWNS